MKKGLWISLAIVVVLAGAYPAVAWYSGKTVETRLTDYRTRMLAQAPYITVADQKYERGIYRSHEEVTYEFGRSLFGALAAASAASGGPTPDMSKALRVTIRSDIRHGPFPGFGQLALARIETEFVMSEATRRELAQAFGKMKPIEIITRLDYGGGGVTEISSPAFENFSLDDGKGTLSWKGFRSTMQFGPDLAWFKVQGSAPGVDMKTSGAEMFRFDEITFQSNSEVAYEDLYVGDVSMAVKRVTAVTPPVPAAPPVEGAPPVEATPSKTVTMDGVEYAGKLDRKEDFLDVNGRLKIASLDVEAVRVNDLHYEVTFKHLHGPTVAEFMRFFRKTLGDGSLGGGPEAQAAIAGEAKRLGIELLKRDPQLVLDRISIAMAEGDAKLSGSVRLVGFEPADLDNSAGITALVPKIDARVDFSIAEGLLEKISASSGRGSLAAFEQQLAALEAQGYVKRVDGHLVTHVEFREGALTFNGKAFVPPPPPPPPATGKPSRDTTHT